MAGVKTVNGILTLPFGNWIVHVCNITDKWTVQKKIPAEHLLLHFLLNLTVLISSSYLVRINVVTKYLSDQHNKP